ncbi:hypothetical protein OsI_03682 [Oryza sativa Indica Group]|uniref:Uncharacterized protein n=1 Tax=Oryza sativa subsp. indica TaxID=39946 RepID=B8A9D4_ORYSI|nr:hypothetical protein OsI_03682 [Oryza sativa Indica Group]
MEPPRPVVNESPHPIAWRRRQWCHPFRGLDLGFFHLFCRPWNQVLDGATGRRRIWWLGRVEVFLHHLLARSAGRSRNRESLLLGSSDPGPPISSLENGSPHQIRHSLRKLG